MGVTVPCARLTSFRPPSRNPGAGLLLLPLRAHRWKEKSSMFTLALACSMVMLTKPPSASSSTRTFSLMSVVSTMSLPAKVDQERIGVEDISHLHRYSSPIASTTRLPYTLTGRLDCNSSVACTTSRPSWRRLRQKPEIPTLSDNLQLEAECAHTTDIRQRVPASTALAGGQATAAANPSSRDNRAMAMAIG